MWCYEKRLQFPVKITRTDPDMAQLIISQYGGPEEKGYEPTQTGSTGGLVELFYACKEMS